MIWRTQARKALISLPVYACVGLSIGIFLQVIAWLVGGETFNLYTYRVLVSLSLAAWTLRQFFRFWFTVAASLHVNHQR